MTRQIKEFEAAFRADVDWKWEIACTSGCSSMVEPQPSKLMMWVRSPSPAPNKVWCDLVLDC